MRITDCYIVILECLLLHRSSRHCKASDSRISVLYIHKDCMLNCNNESIERCSTRVVSQHSRKMTVKNCLISMAQINWNVCAYHRHA
jgi:hypothetical protein